MLLLVKIFFSVLILTGFVFQTAFPPLVIAAEPVMKMPKDSVPPISGRNYPQCLQPFKQDEITSDSRKKPLGNLGSPSFSEETADEATSVDDFYKKAEQGSIEALNELANLAKKGEQKHYKIDDLFRKARHGSKEALSELLDLARDGEQKIFGIDDFYRNFAEKQSQEICCIL